MAKFDRSKFKATKMADIKKQEKEIAAKRPAGGRPQDRVPFLTVDDGENKFRIFPFHPDAGGKTYYQTKCISFLSIEQDKRDERGQVVKDKNDKPVKEVRRKPVFNSKVHSPYGRDIVDEYISFLKKTIDENEPDEAVRKKMFGKVFDWQKGIRPATSYVMYANKIDSKGAATFGLLEIKKSIRDLMNKAAVTEDEDEMMSPDPFTDVEDGICVVIKKAGEKLDTTYDVSLEQVKKGKFGFELIPTPLTDADLDNLMKAEPLVKMFENSFKRSDFELQLEGLRRFDDENGFEIFTYDEFLDKCEEISNLIPEDVKEEDKKVTAKQEEEEEEHDEAAEEAAQEAEEEDEEEDNRPTNIMPWEKSAEKKKVEKAAASLDKLRSKVAKKK